MPRQLYLMRHAQAAEKQPNQDDKDRPLNTQGMRDAATMAHYLKKNFSIDTIVSSSALRANETSVTMRDIVQPQNGLLVTDELYNASVRTLIEVIQSIEDSAKNVLLVGHNPFISYAAEYLTKADIGDMATAGVVHIQFNIDRWREVSEGNGSFEIYLNPAGVE